MTATPSSRGRITGGSLSSIVGSILEEIPFADAFANCLNLVLAQIDGNTSVSRTYAYLSRCIRLHPRTGLVHR